MKRFFALILTLSFSVALWSQNEIDVLRYTYTQYYGTGRSMAMGNAFGALGADAGAMATNPASVATMKHAAFTISPFFSFDKASANFNGTSRENFDYKFALNNWALVFPGKTNDISFGVSMNKIANYKYDVLIEGVNDKGSFMDALMYQADGLYPEELDAYTTGPAFDTYVIDTVPGSLYYTNALWWGLQNGEMPTYGETQKNTITTSGGGNKTDISLAYNFKDKIFFGASLELFSFNYDELNIYSEDFSELDVDIKYFSYTRELSQKVSGLGFSIGMIMWPVKNIRIGAAFHGPTFLTVEERYRVKMVSEFYVSPDPQGGTYFDAYFPGDNIYDVNIYKYKITGPMRMIASVGFVSKLGAFSAEYEYVTYDLMKMKASDNAFTDANQVIQSFSTGNNIRAGGELRLGILRLRAGGAYYSSPVASYISDILTLSGGLGVVSGNTSIDFTVSKSSKSYPKYYMYGGGYEDEPVPSLALDSYSMTVTLGYKF